MKKNANGNTFVEVIIIVLFLSILTTIAVPRFSFSAIFKKNADTTARKIVTDLRRTRTLAITDAANNPDGYELTMSGASPYSSYEIENLDTKSVIDTHEIPGTINCTGGNIFQFGPLGNLIGSSDTQVVISSGDKTFTITIIPATGLVKCVEN